VNNLRDKKILTAFGQHLRKLRIEKGMTLQALAFEVETEISQIHRIEKGEINPTLSTLNALSRALQLSLPELLSF
jgi:transcriptional regulator with XRE-family HTH domain